AAPVGAAAFREALRGGLGVAPVALHVLRAANPDLADLAVGQIAATLRVDDPQLGVAPRLTRGAQQLCARATRVVIALHERHHAARGLGEPVGLHEPAAERLHRTHEHLLADRRGAVDDRALEKSVCSTPGAASRIWSTAGTNSALVTPCSAISFRISAGFTSRVMMFVAPLHSPTRPQPLPAMWNSGIATRFTLAPSNDHVFDPTSIAERKLRWVSSTPFGSPVVPEV